jgi:hypothetical protein
MRLYRTFSGLSVVLILALGLAPRGVRTTALASVQLPAAPPADVRSLQYVGIGHRLTTDLQTHPRPKPGSSVIMRSRDGSLQDPSERYAVEQQEDT